MSAFYNEIEPYPAQWIRNLSDAGHIALGVVDERSITELTADDLKGYTQAHFFAGIAVWSHALRLAGWPDDAEVFTGSCPCQPFSAAGRRGGFTDERHLWPVWFELIRQCRPGVVFGEQVSSPDGLAWFDVVSADLESEDYAVAALDLCAAGVGAPHLRQRLYFVAVRGDVHRESRAVVHHHQDGRGELREARVHASDVGDTLREGLPAPEPAELRRARRGAKRRAAQQSGGAPVSGYWADAEWIPCRDGKYRPVEPGTFPLSVGTPCRVGKLRAYGNAIVAPLAATFIRSVMEAYDL